MQAQAVDTISVNATRGWFQCGKSALQKLAEAEANLFAAARLNLISRLVAIPFKNSQIYTVTQNAEENKALEPIVLLHGFGGGVAIWSACIKSLARHHTVHAIDLLGFGRSSRPTFSKQPDEAEKEMISAIEEWRSAMEIEKMHLVGHSFGAFLASSYALRYPERVKHLILADPWGFSEAYPSSVKEHFPGTFKSSLVNFVLLFNPFAVLRVTGGYAPSLIKKARPDLMRRYPSQHEDDIYNYIYYCNSQSPTGETAFKRMSHMLGWAKNPLYSRFSELNSSVPVSFVLGAHSWVDHEPAYQLQAQARNQIDIKVILRAGHHVYADDPEEFGDTVQRIVDRHWRQLEN